MSLMNTKLRDLGSFLKAPKGGFFKGAAASYRAKYFGKESSATPIFHLIAFVFTFNYMLHYPHIKHEIQAEAAAKH